MILPAHIPAAVLLLALLSGCSSERTDQAPPDSGTPDTEPGDGAAPEATTDVPGDPNADQPATCAAGVWKVTSTRIEIRSSQFFSGRSGYLQERSLLTGAQLAALDGLCVIPTPTLRVADAGNYRITVTDDDGTQTSYRATEGNFLEDNLGLPTIDIHALEPFLDTFSCLWSRKMLPPSVDAGPPWTNAPTMSTDSGCLNGVYVFSGCRAWLKLKVDTPLAHGIEQFECTARTTLKVFTPDGATELAASDPGSGSMCPYVDYALAQSDTYVMSVEFQVPTNCFPNSGVGGDALLRVRP
jgi:hypothetical protein